MAVLSSATLPDAKSGTELFVTFIAYIRRVALSHKSESPREIAALQFYAPVSRPVVCGYRFAIKSLRRPQPKLERLE
jgi:hypothetical protein